MRTRDMLVALLMLLGSSGLAATAQAKQAPAFEACPQDTSQASNATVYVPNNLEGPSGELLQAGDQIALFTPDGTCTGVGTWTGEPLAITVYGSDDWSSFDGYDESELLHFRFQDVSGQISRPLAGTYETCEESGQFTCQDDGRYVADALYTLLGFLPFSLAPTAEPYALEAPAPNPFTRQASFRLTVDRTQNVTVAAYDLLGRQVALLYEGSLGANAPRRFSFEGRARASGLYFIRVKGETFQAVRKAMLVR